MAQSYNNNSTGTKDSRYFNFAKPFSGLLLTLTMLGHSPSADATPTVESADMMLKTSNPFEEASMHLDQLNERLTTLSAPIEKAVVENAILNLTWLEGNVQGQATAAFSYANADMQNILNRNSKSGEEVEINGEQISTWIAVGAGLRFCQQSKLPAGLYLAKLSEGLAEAGGDGQRFRDAMFYDNAMTSLNLNKVNEAPGNFIDASAGLSATKREAVLYAAFSYIVSELYREESAYEIVTLRKYATNAVFDSMQAKRDARFSSPEKLTSTLSELRQALVEDRGIEPNVTLALHERLEGIVGGIQFDSFIKASSEIRSLYPLRNEKGEAIPVDRQSCMAEIAITAGGMTVEQCNGSLIRYQLLVPYFAGFDDSQVKACYEVAFGTATPDESSQPVTPGKLASALLSVAEDISKGETPVQATRNYVALEIFQAAVSAASAEAKGAVCLYNAKDDLRDTGIIQFINLLKASAQARTRPLSEFPAILNNLRQQNSNATENMLASWRKCMNESGRLNNFVDQFLNPLIDAVEEWARTTELRKKAGEALESQKIFADGLESKITQNLIGQWSVVNPSSHFNLGLNGLRTSVAEQTERSRKRIRDNNGEVPSGPPIRPTIPLTTPQDNGPTKDVRPGTR